MKSLKAFWTTAILLAVMPVAAAQDHKVAHQRSAPPYLVVLMRQEILPGKKVERQKLEVAKSRICDRLDVPSYWIRLESLTGRPETLLFNPLESFQEMGQSLANWRRFYAAHPDIARLQEESDSLVGSENRMVAVRRDDLGYRAEGIDLAEARFLRVLELRLLPGRDPDFVEAIKTLADASAEVKADTPWVVYQVELGVPTPTFLIFAPMSSLAQNDDTLTLKSDLSEEQGNHSAGRLEDIIPDSYTTAETNLYAIRPEISHVSKEFAAGNSAFWRPKVELEGKPEPGSSESPSNKRP